ncbi:MAG: ATP-NAD kinase family protein [Candidatus Bathyarchaeota archaeon]|nr:ATP-NAD kinase family protein [Candidatus Bathyarchaeota archaeon]
MVYQKPQSQTRSKIEKTLHQKKVGLVVNPIAGMGGAVGLKGTDGETTLIKALCLGAKPVAPARAELFLSALSPVKAHLKLVVGAGAMGEDEAEQCGFEYTVVGEKKEKTNAEDTKAVAKYIKNAGVELIVFCGGDGTARDILSVIDEELPVLGVPTGVKMHSTVFAVTPDAAARVVMRFLEEALPLKEVEVMDIDEAAFREDHLSAKLYGYVLTPYEPRLIQESKLSSPITEDEIRNQAAIALHIIENMEHDVVYVVGPGTTTRTIGDLLDEKKTLLGVDLFQNKKIVAKDVNEKQILEYIKDKTARVIVTPIGGQGFIFGRGNQQISSKVIRQVGLDNVIVVATASKLRGLKSLRVDTGDPDMDKILRAHSFRVISDYKIEQTMQVE